MKKITFLSAIALSATMVFTACKDEPTMDEGMDVVINENQEDEINEDIFESPDEDYHLPSALQVASIFKKSGMQYNSGVANSVDNAGSYNTKLKQMLNFGVYSADLAYSITNGQSNEARKIIGVIQDLAEVQGLSAVFDNKDLMERFDKNLEIQDSIEMIMFDIHERTEEYMEENDMKHSSAIHYAGAWAEGMYLGVYDFENNSDNKENVGLSISEQMGILGNIIKGCKDPKNSDVGMDDILSDMENIENTYKNFASVKAYYDNEEATEIELSAEDFKVLGELVKDLRAKIVNA